MRIIKNNGIELLKGDGASITMIYNNIVGKNIYGMLYYMYLRAATEYGLNSGIVELYDNDILIEKSYIKIQ